MSIAAEYSTDVLALYSTFIIGDPYCDAPEDGADQARATARTAVIAATRYHAYLGTAQQATKVRLHLRIWNTEPRHITESQTNESWQDPRLVTIEFPEGKLIVENVAAGPVDLGHGHVERINLPGGPGAFAVRVAARGRDDINRLIVDALSADSDAETTRQLEALGGHEQYLIDVWRTGPLADDDDDDDDDEDVE